MCNATKFGHFGVGIFLATWIGATSERSAAAVFQWPTGAGGNDHFYEYVPDRLSWADARDATAVRSHLGMQGYLATVTSAAENDFIADLLTSAIWAAWLGGNDIATEGTFVWDSGPEANSIFWQGGEAGASPLGVYQNFLPYPPNNLNGEHAVGIWGPNGANGPGDWGIWNDFQPSDTHGHVVEFSPDFRAVPEPGALALATIAIISWLLPRWGFRVNTR